MTELNDGIQNIRQEHSAARARLNKMTTISRVLSVALVLVLVGFVAAIFSQVRAMYTPEQFEAPLQEEVRNLVPRIEPELRKLWAETAPVYTRLAIDKLETALPAVEQATLDEFEILRANLTDHARARVDQSLEQIFQDLQARMQEEFSQLSTERGAAELGMHWAQTVEKDLEWTLLHFHERYIEDLGELKATLDQFENERFAKMSKDELSREFIHLWLLKMDRWVMLQDQWQSHNGESHE